MKKIFLLISIPIAIVSCQENLEETVHSAQATAFTAELEVFDAATKTSMDNLRNITWSENDQLAIFQGCSIADKYQVTDESVGTGNGSFTLVSDNSGDVNDDFTSGVEIATNIALYPYSDNLSISKATLSDNDEVTAYTINGYVLPDTQNYVANSFGEGTFPMAAVTETMSDHTLKFKNVLGAIKLQLKGTQIVKSIKIEGNNDEKLSGPATITAYPTGYAPALTMSDEAEKFAILDCGDGVQLNESTATSFIITLPPVLFTKGFTVTLTDSENTTHTIIAETANAILRSSILAMPTVTVDEKPENGEDDDTTYIEYLFLDMTSLTMYPETSYTLIADIDPVNVTYPTITWTSSDETVAKVDQTGKVTTMSDGTANITALAVGGVNASCSVTVKSAPSVTIKNYVVDGVDYGSGINIGGTVWAPVNCGYEPAESDYKGYPYGKLYQWGRKYGQGYYGRLSDINGNFVDYISDETYPSGENIVEGPVMPSVGKSEDNKDKFFKVKNTNRYDWCSVQLDDLWGYGTDKKSEYDPCPDGWKVPTHEDFNSLIDNYSPWTTNDMGQCGYYLVGEYTYIDGISQVFFPAAGERDWYDFLAGARGEYGAYWTSDPYGDDDAYRFGFSNDIVYIANGGGRTGGYSVRCVQE